MTASNQAGGTDGTNSRGFISGHFDWVHMPQGPDSNEWWRRWDALNQEGCSGHPLLESTFVRNALTHFGSAKVLPFACVGACGDLAMALLVKGSLHSWAIFQPSQAPIPFLVFRRGVTQSVDVIAALLRKYPLLPIRLNCHRVDLPYFVEFGEAVSKAAIDLVACGTTIAVSTATSFDDYWSARAKGLQKNLRRYFRRVEQDGMSWRLESVMSPSAMREAVTRYGAIESTGWKGSRGTAISGDNVQGRFYRSLLEDFAASGRAHVYFLWLEDIVVASRLIVSGAGMAVILKTTYDEHYAKYAPGRLLLYLVLKDLMVRPELRRIEFYTNANRDAIEWASDQREMYSLDLYRGHVIRNVSDLAGSVRRRLTGRFALKRKSAKGVPDLGDQMVDVSRTETLVARNLDDAT